MRRSRWWSALAAGFVLAGASCAQAQAKGPLREGDPAPSFSAPGDDGKTYSLAALRGKYVVVYFYPKDDTAGCTVEAQGFRDEAERFAERGAVVLGVSTDDAESHRAFREKHALTFPLLLEGRALAEAFGVPVRLGFASRQTFVIDREGRLMKIFRDVKPQGHAQEILALLK